MSVISNSRLSDFNGWIVEAWRGERYICLVTEAMGAYEVAVALGLIGAGIIFWCRDTLSRREPTSLISPRVIMTGGCVLLKDGICKIAYLAINGW